MILPPSRHPGATPFSGRGRGIKGIKGGEGGKGKWGRSRKVTLDLPTGRSPNPTQPPNILRSSDFLFELVGHRRGTCIHLLRHLRTYYAK